MKHGRQYIRSCMDILFPPACAVCGVRLSAGCEEKMCPGCTLQIRFLCQPICPVCGIELLGEEESGHLCGECLRRPPPYDLARSLMRYETVARELIHKLKYGSDTSIRGALAHLIKGCDLSLYVDCDWIVPVPLHLERLRRRGLNQAAVLARLFFPGRSQAICLDGLIRTRSTVAQTELKGSDRRKNLKNAFAAGSGVCLDNSIICLVDDVFTTGTTVGECSTVLKRQGARAVKVLTLARVGIAR